MKYDIELLNGSTTRRMVGTSFSHLSDAARFAFRLADDLRDPTSFRSLRYGSVDRVAVRRANMIELAVTVFNGPAKSVG